MKKIMFALCFAVGGVVTVSAQDTQDTTSNQYRTETESQYPQDVMGQDQDLERIQATELPDEVKRSIEGEEFRGWLISGAFRTNEADQSMTDTTSTGVNEPGINATEPVEEVFIVELKNGAETKTLKFDSNGQMLEEMSDQNVPNNEFNQNDQMDQTVPADPSLPADPSVPAEPSTPADPSLETDPSVPAEPSTPADPSLETDPNATEQPGQSQTPELETTDPATQPQPDQSTQPEPQPDQSTVTEPK